MGCFRTGAKYTATKYFLYKSETPATVIMGGWDIMFELRLER